VSVRDITDEEADLFQQNGWAHLSGLVDLQTVGLLHRQAEKVLAEQKTERIYGNIVDRSFRDLPGVDRESPQARDMMMAPAMARNMARVLGLRGVRVLIDGFLLKTPEREGKHDGTIFHQDFPGHPVDRSQFLTLWVALHDLPADGGLVQFYNRSHLQGSRGWVFADSVDLRQRCADLKDEDLSHPVAMRAGDATIHHSLTVHGAGPNFSANRRWAYTVIYMDPDTRYNGAQGEFRAGTKVEPYAVLDLPIFPLVPMD
jgi:hypothetical protein